MNRDQFPPWYTDDECRLANRRVIDRPAAWRFIFMKCSPGKKVIIDKIKRLTIGRFWFGVNTVAFEDEKDYMIFKLYI